MRAIHWAGSRVHGRRRARIWFVQHLQAMVHSLGQYTHSLGGQLLTTAVLGISLALPAGFFLLLENARQLTSGWDRTAQFSAFLKEDVDLAVANRLRNLLTGDSEIAGVKLIDKEQALVEYRTWSGFADVIDSLEENPLPHVLVFHTVQGNIGTNATESLLARIGAMPEVHSVQYDKRWMERLTAVLDVAKRVVWVLSMMLAVAVLLIVGNTIRLAIYNRKEEIEVAKLFGATDAFIQRPFLYSGFWHGLFGGLLAWLLINVTFIPIEKSIQSLAGLYDSEFLLITLTPLHFFVLLGIAVVLGLVGSWISVYRHIRAIEPA